MVARRVMVWVKAMISLHLLLLPLAPTSVLSQQHHLQRLLVVHDNLVDFSPSSFRLSDHHAQAAFTSLADSLGLHLHHVFLDTILLKEWDKVSVVGVGGCGVESGVGRGSLVLELEDCHRPHPISTTTTKTTTTTTTILPGHLATLGRRFECAVPVITLWLEQNNHTTTTPLVSSATQSAPSLRPAKSNYLAEYLSCVGDGSEDRAAAQHTPWSVRLATARSYLNGRKMVVATINRPPFIILQMGGEEIVGARGFCIEMLDEMAARFNFTYRLVPPYDGNWGAPMKNGTFNGMVGMVQTQRVDFAIASITITYIREAVIDFTHAFYEDPTTILIPPPREQNNFLAFLEPFSWEVWSLILCSVVVVGPLMWALGSVGSLPAMYPNAGPPHNYPLLKYLWDCATTLTSQPQNIRMRQTGPVRVLNGVWWVFSVILILSYTGTLIAFLTVPRMTSLINSLEELANQDQILWTYIGNSAHETLFANAPSPSTYSKIGQLHKDRPGLLVHTDTQGLEAVLSGTTAFIKEKSFLDFAMERDYLATKECRMAQVKQHFFSAGFGLVLQAGAPYLQLFNNQILSMSQSGLLTNWRQQYWPRPNECTVTTPGQTSAPRALQLKNFSGHFLIYGAGLGLALLTLLGENIVYYNCRD